MTQRTLYHVTTWHEEGFWIVEISELDLTTQARRLDQVEYMARDAIALWLEVPEDSVDIVVNRRIPGDIAERVANLREFRRRAEQAQADAAAEARALARSLHESGYTIRDVGELLGVSYQRAQQLTSGRRAS